MVCLHEVNFGTLHPSKHSLPKKFPNNIAGLMSMYLTLSGRVLKINLLEAPRGPGLLGFTQMSKQTKAPIKKYKMATRAIKAIVL